MPTGFYVRPSVRERIEAGSMPEPNTGCRLWLGDVTKGGKLNVAGKQISVNRAAFAEYIGPVPRDKFVQHKCGVSECVNPDHLVLGDAPAKRAPTCKRCGVFKYQHFAANGRTYYRCETCVSRYHLDYYKKNKARGQAQYKARYEALWREILERYGDRCACCGEHRREFLAVDHINGGGSKHREEIGRGENFKRWLKVNGFPPGFRILCHNCNQARGYCGYCPHEHEREEAAT